MKNFYLIIFSVIILFFMAACAKPKVIDIVMPEDKNLKCSELTDAYLETRRFKEEAIATQNQQGAQTTRMIIFWPALVQSMLNADTAIKAANDRAYHVIDLMRVKKCSDAERYFSELTKTSSRKISAEIRSLNKLYKKGILTEEEFIKAKKKVLE